MAVLAVVAVGNRRLLIDFPDIGGLSLNSGIGRLQTSWKIGGGGLEGRLLHSERSDFPVLPGIICCCGCWAGPLCVVCCLQRGELLLGEILITGSIRFSSSINSKSFSQTSLASKSILQAELAALETASFNPSGPIMIDFLGGGKEKDAVVRDSVSCPFFKDHVVVDLDDEAGVWVWLMVNADEGNTYRYIRGIHWLLLGFQDIPTFPDDVERLFGALVEL